ncbi:MAG: sigma-54-dependent Fis family transcriptional regulator [Acidobacteria bacterium]|nr:MAG: sigma-54-dependent Fis family transcriptional regulator [Acidobacteriota bacterium]
MASVAHPPAAEAEPARTLAASRILIVDDEPAIRESLEALFRLAPGADESFAVSTAADADQGWQAFQSDIFDLVLLDVALPAGDQGPGPSGGLDLLRRIREVSPVPVIMISAYATVELAVEAMRAGAQTFLQKPWNNEKLLSDIRTAIASARVSQENLQLKRALKERYSFENIIGKSEAMLRVFDWIAQVAPSRSTVLLQGESGTGKEVIAKAIHANSPRADGPFVPVNSGSMATDLLESTLFGHVRGAFTGAIAPKKGLFEVADQGTIFLDEIGNMSLETQAKILRVLQDRRFMRLGSVEEIQVDVRVIAATNVNLKNQVTEGKFREDLYYRLNVLALTLPLLRDRRQDIPLLAEHFLVRYAAENGMAPRQLTPEALRDLLDYSWPGHVRELENVIERAVVLSNAPLIGPDLLPDAITGGRNSAPGAINPQSLFGLVDDYERRLILDMLDQTHGRQTEAAERFQIPVSTLNQKIKRHGIDVKAITGKS